MLKPGCSQITSAGIDRDARVDRTAALQGLPGLLGLVRLLEARRAVIQEWERYENPLRTQDDPDHTNGSAF